MTLFRLLFILFLVVVECAAFTVAYFYGRAVQRVEQVTAVAAEAARCQRNKTQQLEQTLQQIQQLGTAATAASAELSKTIAARQLADNKTTLEIRRALQITAPLRADCVFDDVVMQQLAAARDKANAAATTGIAATNAGHTLPSNTGTR